MFLESYVLQWVEFSTTAQVTHRFVLALVAEWQVVLHHEDTVPRVTIERHVRGR